MNRRGRVLRAPRWRRSLAAAVGLIVQATDALRGPEHSTVDARFDLRGRAGSRATTS